MIVEYYAFCANNVRIGKIMVTDDFAGAQQINAFLEDNNATVVLPSFGDRNRFEIRAPSTEILGEYLRMLRKEQEQ